jgi:hypothetical protein
MCIRLSGEFGCRAPRSTGDGDMARCLGISEACTPAVWATADHVCGYMTERYDRMRGEQPLYFVPFHEGILLSELANNSAPFDIRG